MRCFRGNFKPLFILVCWRKQSDQPFFHAVMEMPQFLTFGLFNDRARLYERDLSFVYLLWFGSHVPLPSLFCSDKLLSNYFVCLDKSPLVIIPNLPPSLSLSLFIYIYIAESKFWDRFQFRSLYFFFFCPLSVFLLLLLNVSKSPFFFWIKCK
jgi:hypothetical protein